MYYYYFGSWTDPQIPGTKYQSRQDAKYIIEYLRTEDLFGIPSFVFKSPSGTEVRMGRQQFNTEYKLWIDPWASQKAWAKKYDFRFVEDPEPAIPNVDIEF